MKCTDALSLMTNVSSPKEFSHKSRCKKDSILASVVGLSCVSVTVPTLESWKVINNYYHQLSFEKELWNQDIINFLLHIPTSRLV